MQYRDEFDGPEYGPSVRNAIASIFKALERKERAPKRRPTWSAAVVLSLLAFLGSVLYYSYPREMEKREMMAVPIIRADAGPAKVVPNDPGGMEIPHRDSTVFDTLHAARGDGAGRMENLLPEAEEPVSREELFANLKTRISIEGREVKAAPEAKAETKTVADAGEIETPSVTASESLAPVLTPDENISKELELAAANIPTPQIKPAPEDTLSRIEPAAGVQTYHKATPASGFFVQLASLRSQDAAQASWRDLQKSLSVLGSLGHRVKRVELGARGTYYRLQAGPMEEAHARQVCAAVEKQRPGGCLVVKD